MAATLRNKRKLAAVSRETPENTRNNQSRNATDPEMAQEYISQVSEEIDGRVTKKLSKDFSRTGSRILGALSKLDNFLLSPQFRICSVAVPGTSRNSNSENREPTGDRSLDDPCPDVRFSSHHSGNLNSPEVEDYPHSSLASSVKFFFQVVSIKISSVICIFRAHLTLIPSLNKTRGTTPSNSAHVFVLGMKRSLK